MGQEERIMEGVTVCRQGFVCGVVCDYWIYSVQQEILAGQYKTSLELSGYQWDHLSLHYLIKT